MIIDFHTHCFDDSVAAQAVPKLAERCGIAAKLNGTVADVKESMKRAGVDYSVVLSIATKPSQTVKINNWSVGIQHEGIIAFGSIHPDFGEWKHELDRIKRLGIKGIKFHPDYQEFYVDDKKMYAIYQKAFELDMIVVFHAGVDIGLPEPYHCTPDRLARVAADFPGGKIVAAHMGGYDCWDGVEKFLVGTEVFFDTSFSLGRGHDSQINRIIREHGHGRILFGTDSPWCVQKDEIEKLKGFRLEDFAEKGILGENAGRLLGLE